MIIRVIYRNGQVGTVLPDDLDMLIAKGEIHSFKRSNGWVEVSQGPLRSGPARYIALPERRADVQAPPKI
jgi:hypothetical protein